MIDQHRPWPRSAKATGAVKLIQCLQDTGAIAYLAGGSVRDVLLGRPPKDFDIATDVLPDDVERLFKKTIPIGKQFGIVLVLRGRQRYEVATFRTEGDYHDRRRPSEVSWSTAQADARRRDLTINGLFYDPIQDRVYDFVEGRRDLTARVIRFIGNPDLRIEEDPLRLLRAVRLKNSLQFQYDHQTYQAIRRHAALIRHVSAERIFEELNRMWTDRSRSASLKELAELGLLAVILPEVDALRGLPQPLKYHREGDVFDHSVRAIAALPATVPTFLIWAVLLHDVGKVQTLQYPTSPEGRIRYDGHRSHGAQLSRQIGVRLKMPRVEIETIAWLVDHHMNLVGIETMREATQRRYLLDPRFRWLLELHHADAAGTVPRDLSLYREVKQLYTTYKKRWQEEQDRGRPTSLITGHDLQDELGIEPGPQLGKLLEKIHDAQLEHKITTRAEALKLATELLKNRKLSGDDR